MLKGDIMKIQSRIYLYNFLTVVFALLTFVSLGSVGSMPFYTVAINVVLFGLLTRFCYDKENHLRHIARNRRKNRKVQLSVHKGAVASRPSASVA